MTNCYARSCLTKKPDIGRLLERVDRAGDALLANPPPRGWLPKGPDDELLRTLIPDEKA